MVIFMNKKVIIGVVVVLIIAVLGVGGYFLLNNSADEENNNVNNNNNGTNNNENNNNNGNSNDDVNVSGGRTLVVYFSAQGHTEAVAEQIAENLDADIFEIVPADEYTSDDLDWTDDNSRVTREYEDESLRDVQLVSTEVPNWEDYDTIIIGYPIWWGIAAWPVNTFVEANDFSGKAVIPFCTSSSSGLGQSGELLREAAGTGNWLEGQRFRSNPSDDDIKEFTDSLAH